MTCCRAGGHLVLFVCLLVLSVNSLDLRLSNSPSFYPVLFHDSCTVLEPFSVFGAAEEGIVVNSGHVVALVSEIQPSSALTVSQYVEWGSMRWELLVVFLLLLLLGWFLGCLLFLLLWHEWKRSRKKREREKKGWPGSCFNYTHEERGRGKMLLDCHQPITNGSVWFMPRHERH